MSYIVLDQNKNITETLEKTSEMCGFTRNEDGNFYKILGDERCITDREFKEHLEEQARKDREKEEKKKSKVPLLQGQQIWEANISVEQTELIAAIVADQTIYTNNIIFRKAKFIKPLGLPGIEVGRRYYKIILDIFSSSIQIFFEDTQKPDMIIEKVL